MTVSSLRLNQQTSNLSLQGKRQHVWQYLIKTTTGLDPYAVYSHAVTAGLPDLYARHPTDRNSFVINLDFVPVKPDENTFWRANVTFTQLPEGEDDKEDRTDNPLLRPTRWSLGTTFEEISTYTHPGTDKPILNPLGHLPLEPLRYQQPYATINAEKNYQFLHEIVSMQEDHCGKYNSKKWNGFDKGEVLCESLSTGRRQTENGISFYTANITFKTDKRNGVNNHRRIDSTAFVADDGAGNEVHNQDDFGNRDAGPLVVNAAGEKAAANDLQCFIAVEFGTSDFKKMKLGDWD